MTRYSVRFYKNLLSSDGHPFKCLQRQIDVNDARDVTQAGELATGIFQADRMIGDWQLAADTREVLAVEPAAEIASKRPAVMPPPWHPRPAKAGRTTSDHRVRRPSGARVHRASAG
jgi:hypothetical protein